MDGQQERGIKRPWLNRWGKSVPRATVDIFGKLDRQTQDQINECARENNIGLGKDLTEKNQNVYGMLDHLGKLGLVLQFLHNMGFSSAVLANEFGMKPGDMKEVLHELGVEKCFKARRSPDAVLSLAHTLDDMGIDYETDRRITYEYKEERYSAFPSFYISSQKVVIFVKNSGHIEKTGRQDMGLRSRGYKVLRFTPEEISRETTRVAFDIETAIQSCKLGKEEKKGLIPPYVIAVPRPDGGQ
jgi:hypothetical protein